MIDGPSRITQIRFYVLFNFTSRYLLTKELVSVFNLRWNLPFGSGRVPKQPESRIEGLRPPNAVNGLRTRHGHPDRKNSDIHETKANGCLLRKDKNTHYRERKENKEHILQRIMVLFGETKIRKGPSSMTAGTFVTIVALANWWERKKETNRYIARYILDW